MKLSLSATMLSFISFAEIYFARRDLLVERVARQEGMTKKLKAENQMLWVAMMDNIRQRADEVVKAEII